jgi:hypothetical protein
VAFIEERLLAKNTIDAADLKYFTVTDDPAEAVATIRDAALNKFGLTYGPPPPVRRRWFLFE